MKIFFRALFTVAIVLLLMLSYKIFAPYFKTLKERGLTEVAPKINVLVIDKPHQTLKELFAHVQTGEAQLLLWIEHTDHSAQAYTFNTLESLVRLEKNKLGFLDANDSDLNNLYVATYDATKKILYYHSMRSEKIALIEVNRTYLIGEILSDSKNEKNSAGKIIFSDGTTKELRMVKIPESQVSDATLLPSKK